MLLIEFLLVICSFQVSKKKHRKLLPHLLRPWEEEVKCHSFRQQAEEKEASESHLIRREAGRTEGLRPVRLLQRGTGRREGLRLTVQALPFSQHTPP
ncbi:hypothetical protein PBY51_003354 [Eleginops maclovinus]|uniref:Uncharacterized protein n=1 Tax=Eleginops maclovinus TaxID=56733 RepID=A0AAN8AKA9_ELEMC|nr:hypothetical protein PBY51_003354 [Eleginops maclovinus]